MNDEFHSYYPCSHYVENILFNGCEESFKPYVVPTKYRDFKHSMCVKQARFVLFYLSVSVIIKVCCLVSPIVNQFWG